MVSTYCKCFRNFKREVKVIFWSYQHLKKKVKVGSRASRSLSLLSKYEATRSITFPLPPLPPWDASPSQRGNKQSHKTYLWQLGYSFFIVKQSITVVSAVGNKNYTETVRILIETMLKKLSWSWSTKFTRVGGGYPWCKKHCYLNSVCSFTKGDNDKASSGTKVYVPRTKAPWDRFHCRNDSCYCIPESHV